MNTFHTVFTVLIQLFRVSLRRALPFALTMTLVSALQAQSDYTSPYKFTTLAGVAGSVGSVDGTSANARFSSPKGVAANRSGEVYVADGRTIRKIYSNGDVGTIAGAAGSGGSADGLGAAAQFNFATGIAVDRSGNVYVSDSGSNTIRKITGDYVVTTLAGTAGISGSSDGAGSAACFNGPAGIAVDDSGNVYVADAFNLTIRKITPAGIVTTLAGKAGVEGSADGTGASARFSTPFGIAVDTNGYVYVADTGNQAIRKITPSGVVTTLAGTASSGGSSDGIGAAARFWGPENIAADRVGNIYVTDYLGQTIRKITPAGVVTTLGGTVFGAGSSDGVGSVAHFNTPWGITVDPWGNLYIGDEVNYIIRKGVSITPVIATAPDSKTINTSYPVTFTVGASGSPSPTYQWQKNGVNIAGATDSSYSIDSVAMSDAGSFSVVVSSGSGVPASAGAILTVTNPLTVITLAGLPLNPGATDGVGEGARFSGPSDVAVDAGGNLFVSDQNGTIRKITPAGAVTTLAGLAESYGSVDGPGNVARFSAPSGVAVDGAGNVYVADEGDNTIRKITPAGAVSTVAGQANQFGSTDGTSSTALFFQPSDVAIDNAGTLYVADRLNSTIRKITAGTVSTFAGSVGIKGSLDGVGASARFDSPTRLALDAGGNLYVTDDGNHTVRKVTPAGVVSTVAGTAYINGWVDGVGSFALFSLPEGIAVDSSGNIFVAEAPGTIRKITPTGVVVTVAGRTDDARGSSDGLGSAAHFFYPFGVGVDQFGAVYVTDNGNSTIRKLVTLSGTAPVIATSPVSSTVFSGGSVTFSTTVTGSPTLLYRWQKNGIDIEGATSATLTLSNVQVSDAGSYTVIATNTAGSATSAVAVLTVVASSVGSSKLLGDFDGDGKADLVWSNSVTGERSMWFLNGNTMSGGASLGVVPAAWVVSATADFNGDGKSDILLTNTITDDRAMWLMNGSTITTNAFMGTVPVDWVISGTGDFNGDGKADLVWTNTVSGDRAMWLMNGSTVLGGGYLGTVPVAWTISGVGDFNGDGKADLVWSNTVTGERSMWFQNGSTTISGATLNTVPVAWVISGVGDFNGDGKADIFLTNTVSGDRVIWLMNGSTITTNAFMGTVPVDWTISGTGDFNGDKKKDLFWTNTTNGDRAMWLLNGSTVLGGGYMGTVPVVWTIY